MTTPRTVDELAKEWAVREAFHRHPKLHQKGYEAAYKAGFAACAERAKVLEGALEKIVRVGYTGAEFVAREAITQWPDSQFANSEQGEK